MDRLRDYLGFAIQFAGLGYIGLWPLSTPGRGDLFGAPLLCTGGLLQPVCDWPHPLQFSLGLHAAGALCALLVLLIWLVRVLARVRKRRQYAAAATEALSTAAVAIAPPKRPHRHRLPPPRKIVAPRTHFGLRGLPH